MDNSRKNTVSRKNAMLIKEGRNKKRVSVRKLAEILDVAPSTISRWENNERTIVTGDMVNRVYDVLGLESPYSDTDDVLFQNQEPLYEYVGRKGMYLLRDKGDDLPKKYSIKTSVPFKNIPVGAILDVNSDLFLSEESLVHATIFLSNIETGEDDLLDGVFEYTSKNGIVSMELCDSSDTENDEEEYSLFTFDSRKSFNDIVKIHGVIEGYHVRLI